MEDCFRRNKSEISLGGNESIEQAMIWELPVKLPGIVKRKWEGKCSENEWKNGIVICFIASRDAWLSLIVIARWCVPYECIKIYELLGQYSSICSAITHHAHLSTLQLLDLFVKQLSPWMDLLPRGQNVQLRQGLNVQYMEGETMEMNVQWGWLPNGRCKRNESAPTVGM